MLINSSKLQESLVRIPGEQIILNRKNRKLELDCIPFWKAPSENFKVPETINSLSIQKTVPSTFHKSLTTCFWIPISPEQYMLSTSKFIVSQLLSEEQRHQIKLIYSMTRETKDWTRIIVSCRKLSISYAEYQQINYFGNGYSDSSFCLEYQCSRLQAITGNEKVKTAQ